MHGPREAPQEGKIFLLIILLTDAVSGSGFWPVGFLPEGLRLAAYAEKHQSETEDPGPVGTCISFAVTLTFTSGYLVTVMPRRTAIRSESGGCVLNNPENTWPALRGATMKSDAVVGDTSMGIRLL